MPIAKILFKLSLLLLVAIAMSGCGPDAIDSNGKPIKIADYRGQWVVINYWATWCTPCIREIPDLIKLKQFYKDKVIVLGVNPDNLSNSVLRNLAQGYGINYPLLSRFPITKWGGTMPTTLPVTFIIDPKGSLYQTLVGPQTLSNFQAIMNLPPISYD